MKPVFVKASFDIREVSRRHRIKDRGRLQRAFELPVPVGPAAVPIGQNRPSVQHARNDALPIFFSTQGYSAKSLAGRSMTVAVADASAATWDKI